MKTTTYTEPNKNGVSYKDALRSMVETIDGVKCATYLGFCKNIETLLLATEKCRTVEEVVGMITEMRNEYLKMADSYRVEKTVEVSHSGKV